MSTYKELRGLKVKYVPADTTSPSTAAAGDVWYNSTTFELKGFVGRAAWSAGSLYVISADHTAGTGTQTAALSASDGIPSPAAEITSTYEYNGSGWASGGSMNTGRGDGYMNMAGTQTAAFYVGGRPNGSPPVPFGSDKTEEYNGSAWTETGDYPAGMRGVGAFGIQTAGVGAGGNDGSPSTATATNNEYDGSSWTSGNNNNTARFNAAAFGTSTAGILVGGYSNPPATTHALTEEYDGSSWTESGDLPAANNGLAGGGIQTAGLVFGGSAPSVTTATLNYDGSTWTASPGSLSTARTLLGGAKGGTSLANLAWCGTPQRNITEEYHQTAMTVTQGAWTSGGNVNTVAFLAGGAGTQPAGLKFAGKPPNSGLQATEEYDGSAWTNSGNLGTARYNVGGCGTQTAGLCISGFTTPPSTLKNEVEEYNGSTWTESGNVNTARRQSTGFGIQTAAVYVGGNVSGANSEVEEYDGSTWTEVTDIPTDTRMGGSFGTLTAGLYMGGANGPGTSIFAETYEYDGTNWTAAADLGAALYHNMGSGTQTDGLVTGGWNGSASVATTSGYDGTSWITNPSMARTSYGHSTATSAPSTAALVQYRDGDTDGSEEFTAGSTALNLKTITDS